MQAETSVCEIALFPLHTVIFPAGELRLRIFEARYLDMVSRCLKAGEGFGAALIREGSEIGSAAVHAVGTLVRISDWYTLSGGLLGITAVGEQRFRVISSTEGADRLLTGEVELLPEPPTRPPAPRHAAATAALKTLLALAADEFPVTEPRYDDASWVSGRLAELLPVANTQKQRWLEIDDAHERLDRMLRFVYPVSARD